MTPIAPWPALRMDGELPAALEYAYGVWGKVHGVRSDFRWIARSATFAEGVSDLDRALNLGTEDRPHRFQAWRSVGDRCYAVSAYPSRARDASGRSGFLEKQVLEWHRPPDVPAAVAALLLLPRAAELSDAIWWDRFERVNWADAGECLPIGDAHCEPLAFDGNDILAAIDRGREALRDVAQPEALAQLYEQLLRGVRPAFFSPLMAPLPPEGLAALLLPLPRGVADRISIAGWVPSGRPQVSDLATRWEILVAPSSPPSSVALAVSNQARTMAADLLHRESVLVSIANAEDTLDADAVETVPAATMSVSSRPGCTLALAPPDPAAGPLLRELYEFARFPQRRWLDRDMLPRPVVVPDATQRGASRIVFQWIEQLREQRPQEAHPAQWGYKIDLLRSMAIVLLPEPSTIDAAGLPAAESRVLALHFALLLRNRECDRLIELGAPSLHKVIVQSLTCAGSRTHGQDVRKWLADWRRNSSRDDVKRLINDAFAAA